MTFCRMGAQRDGPAREPPRAREHEEIAHDLRGAVRLAVDRLYLLAQCLRERARDPQQLEVAEHALERVVELVGDAGDELAERHQLLRLRQALAQLLALGFELGLRRQVARHEHGAQPLPFLIEQVRQRHHERALQDRVDDFPARRGLGLGPDVRRLVRGEPRRRARGRRSRRRAARAGPPCDFPTRLANASLTWTMRPWRSATTTRCQIESKVFSSSRRDRMTSSSSCSVSMALDSWRPSSSARSSRSSSPPVSTRTPSKTIVPSARRHPRSGTVTVEVASSAGDVTSARECRSAAAAGANASCALTVTPRTTCPGSDDPGARDGAPADRESRPTCGPRRTAAWRPGRRSRAPPSGSSWPRCRPRSRRSASRRSRCSSSRRRRRFSSSAVRNASRRGRGVGRGRRRSRAAADSRRRAGRCARPRATSGSSRAAGVPRRAARSGISRPTSATNTGAAPENACETSAASSGPGIHGSVRNSSSP